MAARKENLHQKLTRLFSTVYVNVEVDRHGYLGAGSSIPFNQFEALSASLSLPLATSQTGDSGEKMTPMKVSKGTMVHT